MHSLLIQEILGPLPGEFHYDIRFGAAASATTKNAEAARALIRFVTSPEAAPLLQKGMMEPASR